MKKKSSAVWHFFDRIEDNSRCIAVVCKLCDNEYKYFGNTTNLRVHLTKKHPYQWELKDSTPWEEEKSTDESTVRIILDDENITSDSTITKAIRRKSISRVGKDKSVRYSLSNKKPNYVTDADKMHTIEIQRLDVLDEAENQLHDDNSSPLGQQLDEEWLDDEPRQPAKQQRTTCRRIKREAVSPVAYIYPPTQQTQVPQQRKEYIQLPKREADEMTSFGTYVGNKLRKFKSSRTQSNLQQIISTILWQAEYGIYDHASTVKRVLLSSIQESFPEQTQNKSEQEQVHETVNSFVEESVEMDQ